MCQAQAGLLPCLPSSMPARNSTNPRQHIYCIAIGILLNTFLIYTKPNTKYSKLNSICTIQNTKDFRKRRWGGWGQAGKETLENTLLFLLECTLTFNTKYIIPNINLTNLNQARQMRQLSPKSENITDPLTHCTMAQVLKEMGNRKNQCFRAHFFSLIVSDINT